MGAAVRGGIIFGGIMSVCRIDSGCGLSGYEQTGKLTMARASVRDVVNTTSSSSINVDVIVSDVFVTLSVVSQ